MFQSEAATQLSIAVLVPCYNEESTVGKVVADFKSALPQCVVFVYDNNSTDHTVDCAIAAGAIVRLEQRQGKGNVVRRMFADIDADIYILVDGDDTYDASYSPSLVNHLLTHQLDMLNVVRQPVQQNAYRPGHELGNRCLNFFVQFFFENQFKDMLSGYRVFTRRFVKSFPILTTGFEIETELTVHAIELQMPSAEVQIPFRERPQGSVSKLNTIFDGLKILRLIVRLTREDRPLQFFGFVSILLLLVASILMWPVMLEYFETGLVPKFPTVILSTALGLLSSLSFAVGLVLDTVTRGRRELKRLYYLGIPVPWLNYNPDVLIQNDHLQSSLDFEVRQRDDFNGKTSQSSPGRTPKDKYRFLRFACVGAMGFIIDTLFFAALINVANSPIFLARAIAFLPAVTFTWYLNRNLTFGDRGKSPKKRQEYFSYVMVYLLGTSVNFMVFMAIVLVLPWASRYWLIPLLAGTAAGLAFNYLLLNLRIFRQRTARRLSLIGHHGHQL